MKNIKKVFVLVMMIFLGPTVCFSSTITVQTFIKNEKTGQVAKRAKRTLKVDLNDTIGNLSQKIVNTKKSPKARSPILTFQGQTLFKNKTLKEYGIKNNSNIDSIQVVNDIIFNSVTKKNS